MEGALAGGEAERGAQPPADLHGGGLGQPHRAMVTVTRGLDAAQLAFEACERGGAPGRVRRAPERLRPDRGAARRPDDERLRPVRAYELAEGDWESREEEIGDQVLDLIEAYAPDIRECLVEVEVLGAPDIEARIGLSGGNIFQGEALPDQMWDRRLDHRRASICGAATHPAGSVIALNGRNAAIAVLEDAGVAPAAAPA